MKFKEPRTFRSAVSPVILVRQAFGIGAFEYPTGRLRRAVSVCWSGAYLILFLYFISVAMIENVEDLEDSKLTRTAYPMYFVAITICGVTLVYLGQVRSKNVVDSLCKLEKVNEMMNKLGIPKEYGSIFKSQIIHLIGTFVFMFTMLVFPLTYYFNDLLTSVIGSAISNQYIILIGFLEDYTFSICVRYIGKRFRHLNTILDTLSIKDEDPIPFFQDLDNHIPWLSPIAFENHSHLRYVVVADKQWMTRVLQNARKIHQDLCDIAMTLNEAFGVQILVSMTVAIAVITGLLCSFYTLFLMHATNKMQSEIKILSDLIRIGFYTIKVYMIISACSMATNEAHQTADRIHELIEPTTSIEIKEELHTFSLQLMQNPLEFTAYGFFTLDYTVIRAMVGTITTYLVFIIQMPQSPDQVDNLTKNAMTLSINTTVGNNRSEKFSSY